MECFRLVFDFFSRCITLYTCMCTCVLDRTFAADAKWASVRFEITWPGNFELDRSPFGVSGESSLKVTFRGPQFESCTPSIHTVVPADAHGGGEHPYVGAFQARKTMSWSGRAVITGSVSCVTSQCDFECCSELLPLTPNGLRSGSKLPCQLILNWAEAHLASAAKARSNNTYMWVCVYVYIYMYELYFWMHMYERM